MLDDENGADNTLTGLTMISGRIRKSVDHIRFLLKIALCMIENEYNRSFTSLFSTNKQLLKNCQLRKLFS